MRKIAICLSICLFCFGLNAQFTAGPIVGLSTFDVNDNDVGIFDENGVKQFTLLLEDASYGYHLGMFTQIQLGSFIIRPEFVFNSNSANFVVFDEENPLVDKQVFKESYQHFDIPLMLGFKFGPVRLNAGPVGHVFLNSTSDLFKFSDYDQTFKDLTLGWQGGIGLDIWRVNVDLRYEDNFTNFGDHISFFGNDYEFSDRPSRFIATVGFRL